MSEVGGPSVPYPSPPQAPPQGPTPEAEVAYAEPKVNDAPERTENDFLGVSADRDNVKLPRYDLGHEPLPHERPAPPPVPAPFGGGSTPSKIAAVAEREARRAAAAADARLTAARMAAAQTVEARPNVGTNTPKDTDNGQTAARDDLTPPSVSGDRATANPQVSILEDVVKPNGPPDAAKPDSGNDNADAVTSPEAAEVADDPGDQRTAGPEPPADRASAPSGPAEPGERPSPEPGQPSAPDPPAEDNAVAAASPTTSESPKSPDLPQYPTEDDGAAMAAPTTAGQNIGNDAASTTEEPAPEPQPAPPAEPSAGADDFEQPRVADDPGDDARPDQSPEAADEPGQTAPAPESVYPQTEPTVDTELEPQQPEPEPEAPAPNPAGHVAPDPPDEPASPAQPETQGPEWELVENDPFEWEEEIIDVKPAARPEQPEGDAEAASQAPDETTTEPTPEEPATELAELKQQLAADPGNEELSRQIADLEGNTQATADPVEPALTDPQPPAADGQPDPAQPDGQAAAPDEPPKTENEGLNDPVEGMVDRALLEGLKPYGIRDPAHLQEVLEQNPELGEQIGELRAQLREYIKADLAKGPTETPAPEESAAQPGTDSPEASPDTETFIDDTDVRAFMRDYVSTGGVPPEDLLDAYARDLWEGLDVDLGDFDLLQEPPQPDAPETPEPPPAPPQPDTPESTSHRTEYTDNVAIETYLKNTYGTEEARRSARNYIDSLPEGSAEREEIILEGYRKLADEQIARAEQEKIERENPNPEASEPATPPEPAPPAGKPLERGSPDDPHDYARTTAAERWRAFGLTPAQAFGGLFGKSGVRPVPGQKNKFIVKIGTKEVTVSAPNERLAKFFGRLKWAFAS